VLEEAGYSMASKSTHTHFQWQYTRLGMADKGVSHDYQSHCGSAETFSPAPARHPSCPRVGAPCWSAQCDGRQCQLPLVTGRYYTFCPLQLLISTDQLLANVTPLATDKSKAEHLSLLAEQATGVTKNCSKAKQEHWRIWTHFCHDAGLNPSLFYIQDPVPVLRVFIRRFADKRPASSGKPISGQHAEDAGGPLSGPDASRVGDQQLPKRPVHGYRQQAGYKKCDQPQTKKNKIPKHDSDPELGWWSVTERCCYYS
jgi:hypothetical protein